MYVCNLLSVFCFTFHSFSAKKRQPIPPKRTGNTCAFATTCWQTVLLTFPTQSSRSNSYFTIEKFPLLLQWLTLKATWFLCNTVHSSHKPIISYPVLTCPHHRLTTDLCIPLIMQLLYPSFTEALQLLQMVSH